MEFLPKDFKLSSKNDIYFKPQTGDNRIRILSGAITGYVMWKDGAKICARPGEKEKMLLNPMDKPKDFIAFAIWDYATQRVMVYELTQVTIIKELEAMAKEGPISGYDIRIRKTGDKPTTIRYSLIPCDPTPIGADIVARWKTTPIYLEAQYEGGYPHLDKIGPRTVAFFEGAGYGEPTIAEKKTAQVDVTDLQSMLLECSAEYQKQVEATLASKGFKTLAEAPGDWIARLAVKIPEKRQEHMVAIGDCPF